MSVNTSTQRNAINQSQALERDLAADPGQFRALTGDRPTGALHIGHLFGTLQNRVRLQNLGVELIVLVADYQVLTDRNGHSDLREVVRGLVADYLAVGIDPGRSVIFAHSAVPELNELMLPFLSVVSEPELRRNPTVKAEAEQTGRPPSGLMFTYPVHQAADILFCRSTVVPVGLDQLPHVEMARLIARRFNHRYGDVFPVPRALLTETPLLLGLDGKKMSKSQENGIAIRASDDETAAIVRRAATDSERHIAYEPKRRPRVSALLDLLATVTGRDAAILGDEIGAGGAGALKEALTEAINETLRPIRNRRTELASQREELDRVLAEGNARAREYAAATLSLVHHAVGMTYAET